MSRSLQRLRVPLGFAFAAWYLAVAQPTSVANLALCLVLVLLGCALRSWAAGYLFKGKRVAVGGPYAYVRNPLYLGSFLIGLGFCAILWRTPLPLSSIVLWAGYFLGFGLIYPLKTRAEEGELRTNLGEPYVKYAAAVPPYLPTRGHVAGLGEQHFSRELYRRNREYQCLLGSAALLIFLGIRFLYAH